MCANGDGGDDGDVQDCDSDNISLLQFFSADGLHSSHKVRGAAQTERETQYVHDVDR